MIDLIGDVFIRLD